MRQIRLIILILATMALFGSVAPATADDDEEPSAVTSDATAVTSANAVLHGWVNPNDSSTHYRFEYGTSPSDGSQTPSASAGSGDEWRSVSAQLTGLAPDTKYFFRLVAWNSEGTDGGSVRWFRTAALPAPSDPGPGPTSPAPGEMPAPSEPTQPQPASTVGVAPRGSVSVRLPGSSKFIPLTAGSQLPYGSAVDAREGSVALTSALPSGDAQSGRFGGGRFVVRRGRRGFVDLHLRGPVCPARARASAEGTALAVASARRGRRLWGRDRGGRFRTHGKYSHATVRGTAWSVADTCAGTLTRVRKGAVLVRDLTSGKRRLLEAGERYLARPRR